MNEDMVIHDLITHYIVRCNGFVYEGRMENGGFFITYYYFIALYLSIGY